MYFLSMLLGDSDLGIWPSGLSHGLRCSVLRIDGPGYACLVLGSFLRVFQGIREIGCRVTGLGVFKIIFFCNLCRQPDVANIPSQS